MTCKLIFLSGSIRKESYNAKLAKLACTMAQKQGADATYIDLKDYDMPIYNGDLEDEKGLPQAAKDLKKIFIDCDGFFIASPEYNSGYTPLLKNTIDWLSRQETDDEKPLVAFKGKVGAISSASPGALGGLRSLAQLRTLLGNIGVTLVPQQIAISKAMECFDDNGNLTDDKKAKTLQNIVQEFIRTATALKQ
jgi:NAD(P)H-dependent FMN reductase